MYRQVILCDVEACCHQIGLAETRFFVVAITLVREFQILWPNGWELKEMTGILKPTRTKQAQKNYLVFHFMATDNNWNRLFLCYSYSGSSNLLGDILIGGKGSPTHLERQKNTRLNSRE